MRLNGVIVSMDIETIQTKNYSKLYQAVSNQLASWSNRNLSILGKIQIFKTYGLSQILFLGSVIHISKTQEKQLDSLIYKFIWSKSMVQNKAPDRIKRSILAAPISKLGFGMIDYKEVLRSIRIKNVIRYINLSKHPISEIIKSNISCSVLWPKSINKIRETIDLPLKELKGRWNELIKLKISDNTPLLCNILSDEYIGNLTKPAFRNRTLVKKHAHDKLSEIAGNNLIINAIMKYCDPNIHYLLENFKDGHSINFQGNRYFPLSVKIIPIAKITSKIIRDSGKASNHIIPKMLPQLDVTNLSIIGSRINRLTNTKNKGILLRVMHGDIYSGTRLKKFGMTESDTCPRCGESEDINHQIMNCPYTKIIWEIVSFITGIPHSNLSNILGNDIRHNKASLALNAEIIKILLAIDRPTQNQGQIILKILERLSYMEKGVSKYECKQLINQLNIHLTFAGSS